MKMVRAQLTNGEPMGTRDIEEQQVKFLKEDLDFEFFAVLKPVSAGTRRSRMTAGSGYTKIPYDSRPERSYSTRVDCTVIAARRNFSLNPPAGAGVASRPGCAAVRE